MKLGEHEMKSNQSVADEIRKYMNYIYLILFAGITMWYYRIQRYWSISIPMRCI